MKNIYQKLFDIKKEGIKLVRDTEGYGYKYATLSQIQDKLGPLFEKHNLLIVHTILDGAVRTTIIDIEAEENAPQTIQSMIPMAENTKPQDRGSEITYYRRYNLLALLDLEVEDDDGAKASGVATATKKAEDDNKQWFNDEALERFKAIKDNYTKETAVKQARKKYKVSKKYAQLIEELY